MVNLTRIYTRTGDAGTTRLGDMSETSKNDSRLHAYADVDEAGAHLGLALALGDLDPDVVAVLTHVQNDLFDVGADLCTPVVPEPEYPPLLGLLADHIGTLETLLVIAALMIPAAATVFAARPPKTVPVAEEIPR